MRLTRLSELIVAGNVGIMLFFTVAVALTIFMALPAQWSAAYMRKFFPKYFLFLGITTATLAALSGTPLAQAFEALHYASHGLNLLQLAGFIRILWPGVRAA